MKIKNKILLFLIAALILSCNNGKESDNGHKNHSNHQEQKVYTCPMHPQIIQDKPGQCPICGMELVEKISDGQKENNNALELLLKPTNKYVISQVNTITAIEKELPIKFSAAGYITYDTRQMNTVSARVSGRIEKLYVKYRYQPVGEGQKLMDVYSKELETEQQNLLFLLKNDSENSSLIKASEQKLSLLGLTTEQINQVKTSGKIYYSVTIYSPYTGHLHDIIQTDNSMKGESGMEGDMAAPTLQELQIKEGMYITKGQTIFNIYDTRKIWALLNIYPDSQSSIKKGQKVNLKIDGLDREVEATINFIEPVIRSDQKSITVRAYLNNPSNEIKIGAIVKIRFDEEKQKGVFIPSKAIVSLGLNSVVFVKEDGLFKTKKIAVGARSDGWTEIVSGLNKGDSIAENGQLLIDSESFIKTEK